MANNYLDYDGLALYDEKIKQVISGKVDKDGAKGLSTNDYTTAEKNKLAGITAGAEPNQNAFSTVSVDGTALAADTKTDTLTITAGENVTLTPTASSDSFVIAATDTTYPEATSTKGGVLTDAQAVKLNGIATGATKNTASSTTPKMDGTAAVGTETAYAKGDHVHPTDTSRQEKLVSGTNIKTVGGTSLLGSGDVSVIRGITLNTPSEPYDVPVNGGTATIDLGGGLSVDDSNHKVTISADIPSAGTAAPKMDGTAAVGTSASYARADHVHPTDTSRAAAADLAKYLPLAGGTMADNARIGLADRGTLYLGMADSAEIMVTENGGDEFIVLDSKDTVNLHAQSISLSGRNNANAISINFKANSVTSPTPTAGDNSTKVATTAFVTTAVASAIAGVQGISYEVVQTLPATGAAGTIYLISNSGTAPNIYDEYIWTGTAFEKIGTTDVDLSGYQPKMDAITNAQINGLFA
jgi:hypothetical protein